MTQRVQSSLDQTSGSFSSIFLAGAIVLPLFLGGVGLARLQFWLQYADVGLLRNRLRNVWILRCPGVGLEPTRGKPSQDLKSCASVSKLRSPLGRITPYLDIWCAAGRNSVYGRATTATLILLAGTARTRIIPPNLALRAPRRGSAGGHFVLSALPKITVRLPQTNRH